MSFWSKKQNEGMNVAFEGKEVNVNPTPTQRAQRNLGRIGRIKLSLKKFEKRGLTDSPRYEKFRRELRWREMKLDMDELRGGN